MARFTGHLVCQAFKVRALDELIELVKVYDWHKGEDGIAVRPEGSDYLFWGASQVEDPRLVPFEVVPGRDGTLVEQPLRDPTAFMRQIADMLHDDGEAVLIVSGLGRLDPFIAHNPT